MSSSEEAMETKKLAEVGSRKGEEEARLNLTNRERISSLAATDLHMVEILPKFLYLGSYNTAFNLYNESNFTSDHKRVAAANPHGISHVLNVIPDWQNLFKDKGKSSNINSHSLLDNDAIQFIDECEKNQAPVLVFCMSGNSRSPAIVIAYLMKYKQWTLQQSYQWVKQRRPSINLSPDTYKWLEEFEKRILDSGESNPMLVSRRVPESSSPPDEALGNLSIEPYQFVETRYLTPFPRIMGWPHILRKEVRHGKCRFWLSGFGNEQQQQQQQQQQAAVCLNPQSKWIPKRKRMPKPVKDGFKSVVL